MVEYTINAVNNLLVDLRRDTDQILLHAAEVTEKIPCPYTKDYLRMIRERAQDINILSEDITKLKKDDVVEKMHKVLDDIVMVQGPVHNLIGLRRNHEESGELKPNGILGLLGKYSEVLDDYINSIYDLIR